MFYIKRRELIQWILSRYETYLYPVLVQLEPQEDLRNIDL